MLEPEPLAAWRKEAEYQLAKSDAAMARLRVAVEALKQIEGDCAFNEWLSSLVKASQTLALIGDLPPGREG